MREIRKREYKLQKDKTKALTRMKRENSEKEMDERLTNNFRENAKLFCREVSDSRGCSVTSRMKGVLSKNGEILTEQAHVLQWWAEFYKETYEYEDASASSISEILSPDVADGEISLEEVESAIRSLKCDKAAGADEVTAEMIKYGGPRVLDLFWLLCNLCWKSGKVPDDWRGARP